MVALFGESLHNQRIESLWYDAFQGCLVIFYKLSFQMEEYLLLNINDDSHLFSLHYVYQEYTILGRVSYGPIVAVTCPHIVYLQ